MRLTSIRRAVMPSLAAVTAAILLAPIAVLWAPGANALRRHAYHEVVFQWIVSRLVPATATPDEIIRAAMDYNRRHLWLVDNQAPYHGKPFDYLVEGIGWCDYNAKVFCKLLAARGMHARYAFLKDRAGRSPHTIAEVYLQGKWRAMDPFFNLTYADTPGQYMTLEEVTPERIARLPELVVLRHADTEFDESILALAQQVFPIPMPPQRSDDFLRDRNFFDDLTALYVRCFGDRFVRWYQDQFLRRELATFSDPVQRLWCQARHYHVLGRLDLAEPCYDRLRQLVRAGQAAPYRERVVLFLSRLLIRERRWEEARNLLEGFVQEKPDARWAHYQLARCCEEFQDFEQTQRHLRAYQRLHGMKWAVEAARRLAWLTRRERGDRLPPWTLVGI